MVWNLSPLKVILVLGKAISHVVPNLGSREHWVTWVIWCFAKNSPWDEIDEAANDWLPLVAAFWIIWIVSMEECSNLLQNLIQICCSTCSVILNAIVTQYTCSLNGIYHPPLTSAVKSSLLMHAHSSPLSLAVRLHWCGANHSHYTSNGGLFIDRPHVSLLKYF